MRGNILILKYKNMNEVFIDVTILEPRMKHPTIFDAFDRIISGEAVVIHNDHDPKPLYYQLLGERGNCFSWIYLENGPQVWKVEIRKHTQAPETVGAIAAADMRKAELLKRLGIDFCCGGKHTLEEACQEKNLDVLRVKKELEDVDKLSLTGQQHDFNAFTPSFLADYIVNVHHSYVNNNLPMITELAEKVALHHGSNRPYLERIFYAVNVIGKDLCSHMKMEEEVLFPAIKQLERGENREAALQVLRESISGAEDEHQAVGQLLKDIHELTGNFTLYEGACNSVGMLYFKLKAFEDDLLQHIHLENNILFPKVLHAQA